MKRKIAISCYPSVGGSGVIATELGKALAERGHEVHFITFDVPFRLDKIYANVFYHEVEVNQYSVFKYPPYDLTLASKIAEVVKREGIELIHAHYAVPHAICAYLAKQMVGDQLKIITTLHGTDITVLGYDPTLSEMIRLGIEQSDTVTAVSNHLVSQTKELLQTKRPIETIYNFVDERFYYKKEINDLKKAYHIEEDEKVIIHISNFRPVKRMTDIIRSFALIRKKVKAKLILLGDGPERSIAGKLATELGICSDVLFLGSQNQVADFLAISDLKLLLSEKESFGLVALEAMACEVPVIATNIGGIPEVVVDGETGYLCELGDIVTVAERAVELLLDEKRRIEMGKRARERVESRFSLEQIVSQYEDIYERTLRE